MPKVNNEYPGPTPPTDAEIKARAIKDYNAPTVATENKKSKEKSKFPTEIIDLPSKGLLYPKDNPLSQGQIEMKYMTAKEEDILTSQSYIKNGTVLDKLFRALIIGNGNEERINYADLIMGDKNAIMVAARVLGYGKEYEASITTPSGNKIIEQIDLTTFMDKEFDESLITPNCNEFEFELPTSKRLLKFKILCTKDQQNIEAELKGLKKVNRGGLDSTLTTRLMHSIIAIDGDDNRATIRNFVNLEFLARDSRAFREHLIKIQPDVDLKVKCWDDETNEPFEVDLPINVNFFWPGV
tara:strand:- start:3160 stop:4050 length:891 start_codon:yes stop_codon:yes gene_type:complete